MYLVRGPCLGIRNMIANINCCYVVRASWRITPSTFNTTFTYIQFSHEVATRGKLGGFVINATAPKKCTFKHTLNDTFVRLHWILFIPISLKILLRITMLFHYISKEYLICFPFKAVPFFRQWENTSHNPKQGFVIYGLSLYRKFTRIRFHHIGYMQH